MPSIGIEVSADALDFFLSDMSFSDKVPISSKVSNLSKLHNSVFRISDKVLEGEITLFEEDGGFKNPLLNNETQISLLSTAESVISGSKADSSIRLGDKTAFTYSNPSYVHNTINGWKKDLNKLKVFSQSTYTKSSQWIKSWLNTDSQSSEESSLAESRRRMKNVAVGLFAKLQEKNKSTEGVDNKEVTRDDTKVDYFNKVMSNISTGKIYIPNYAAC